MTTTDASGIQYDTLEQESSILDQFDAIKNPNHKKVKKLAWRLLHESKLEVQRKLCRDVLQADNALDYVRECVAKIRDCALLVQYFIEDGHHGMIFTGEDGKEVWPVTLSSINLKWFTEGKPWCPEEEMRIQHDAANALMKEKDIGYFHGKVVLFPKFGFSGEPRIVEMQCGAGTEGQVRYPGTNYWYTPTSEITARVARKQGGTPSLRDLFHTSRRTV